MDRKVQRAKFAEKARLTYMFTCLFAYLPICLLAYLLTSLLPNFLTCLLAYLLTCLLAYFLASLLQLRRWKSMRGCMLVGFLDNAQTMVTTSSLRGSFCQRTRQT